MKISYILFITFFFSLLMWSCQKNSENQIAIYNDYFFEKFPSETEMSIDFTSKEKYNTYFLTPSKKDNQKSIGQIPLFKYFQGKDYQMFIGVPYQLTFQEITTQLVAKEKNDIQITESDSVTYINYKNNTEWITECIIKLGDSSTIYFTTIQDSISYQNNKELFSSSSITKRFRKK